MRGRREGKESGRESVCVVKGNTETRKNVWRREGKGGKSETRNSVNGR